MTDLVYADKGYDTNAMRWRIEAKSSLEELLPAISLSDTKRPSPDYFVGNKRLRL